MTGYAGSRDYVGNRTPAQNSQRKGRSLSQQGRDNLFQWDVGTSVGFFTETTGSLRNPETLRTPSYVCILYITLYTYIYMTIVIEKENDGVENIARKAAIGMVKAECLRTSGGELMMLWIFKLLCF